MHIRTACPNSPPEVSRASPVCLERSAPSPRAPGVKLQRPPCGVNQVKFSVWEERPSQARQKSSLGVWRTDRPPGWAESEREPVCSERSPFALESCGRRGSDPLPQLLAVLTRGWDVRGAACTAWICGRKMSWLRPSRRSSHRNHFCPHSEYT